METKVAGYIRVSTPGQDDEDKSSPEIQRESIQKCADKNNWKIVKEYKDTESGTSFDRTEFNRLMADAREKQFSRVLFYDWDRLGRNVKEALETHDELKDLGLKLVCTTLDLDTESDAGRMIMITLSNIAEYEFTQLRKRMGGGRKAAIDKGLTISGKVPFGYQRVKKLTKEDKNKKVEIIVHPEEAKTYKKIVTLALQGKSTGLIKRALNDEHILSREGKPWIDNSVRRVLRNPVYLGVFHYDKSTDRKTKVPGSRKKVRVKTPMPESTWKSMEVTPLISKRDFDKIQKMLSSRTAFKKPVKTKVEMLLRGLLRCGHCDSKVVAGYHHQKSGNIYRFYYCYWSMNKHLSEKMPKKVLALGGCPLPLMNAEALEDQVMGEIFSFFMHPEKVVEHLEGIWDSSNLVRLKDEFTEIGKRINAEKGKQEKWLDLFGADQLDKEMLFSRTEKSKKIISDLQERLKTIDLEIDQIQSSEESLEKFKKASKDVKAMSGEIFKTINNLSLDEKRAMLSASFDSRFVVRTATVGDVADLDAKLTKEQMVKPLMVKTEKGYNVRQVVVEAEWKWENFVRMLTWLKENTKIKSIGSERWSK